MTQSAPQPSPAAVLPSSHSSAPPVAMMPSPHVAGARRQICSLSARMFCVKEHTSPLS